MKCCTGRIMAGPSGVKRRHTCRARFGETYHEPRQTTELARRHRAETARVGLAVRDRVSISGRDLKHWSRCNLYPCAQCQWIEAHLDDDDDNGVPW